LIPERKYRIQNIKRNVKNNKQYLSSTNTTTVQEISDTEIIDEITIAVTEQIRDQSNEKRFRVLTPAHDNMELSLLLRYNPSTVQLEGIYKLQNVVAIDGFDKIYLQNTQGTVINEATDVQYNLDLFIVGDTHIGYQNLPESTRNHKKDICRKSFKRLIQRSVTEDIDGIIHTGDIFESSKPTDVDYEWVKNKLKTLQKADIGFVYIRGDHDPSQSDNIFPQLEHVMHLGAGEKRQYAGFSFIGYDHDQISHPNEIPSNDYLKTLIFIHPSNMDCSAVYDLDSPDIECTQSAIFAGHCHTTGKRIVQETPLIFTGSPAGMNWLHEGSSLYRAKIWKKKVILLYQLSLREVPEKGSIL